MSKALKIFFVALIVIGAAFVNFTDIPVVEYTALAVTFGSAGLLCATTIGKSEKKDWKSYLAVICIAAGSFGLGFCNISTEVMTKVIIAVVSVVSLVVGLLISFVPLKKE